jgi:hypothetical protein
VIFQPNASVVDTTITVNVQVQDVLGNRVPSFASTVTLVSAGISVVTSSGGVVTIVAGQGSIPIRTTVAQTVQLSLQDSAGTGLSVTSTRSLVVLPGEAATS